MVKLEYQESLEIIQPAIGKLPRTNS